MLFITFTEKKGDLTMNKESQKRKIKENIEGALSLMLMILFTLTTFNILKTRIFATIFMIEQYVALILLVLIDAIMVAANFVKQNKPERKDKKVLRTPYAAITKILLVFSVLYKIMGYSSLSWKYFIPIFLNAFLIAIFSILTRILLYRNKTNIYETALIQLPVTLNNNEIFKRYDALKDDLSMNMSIGSKEWRKATKELAKYYYQEATNTIY